MQNRVKVVICGKTYTLQTDESPSYMISLAKELDKRINAFLEENESAALPTAAVLVGLELMDESNPSPTWTTSAPRSRATLKKPPPPGSRPTSSGGRSPF